MAKEALYVYVDEVDIFVVWSKLYAVVPHNDATMSYHKTES